MKRRLDLKCVDKTGHEFKFVGYLVVANKLEDNVEYYETSSYSSSNYPNSSIYYPSSGTWSVFLPTTQYFPAKIEVHQCKKCGWVKLQPAVFTRILKEG